MKLQTIELQAKNLLSLKQFYTETLGLAIVHETTSTVAFAVGESTLLFHETHNAIAPYHIAIEVPSNAIAPILSWAEGRLEFLEAEPNEYIVEFEAWRAQALYFYDSVGNILEFITRKDNAILLDGAFSSDSIIRMSEVAFGTADVAAFVATVQAQMPIDHFSKQVRRDNFAALGTDEGLLIISQDTRKWFPTAIDVQPNWTKVRLEAEGQLFDFETKGNE